MLYRISDEDDPEGVSRDRMAELLDELSLYAGSSDCGGTTLPPQWRAVPVLTSQEWTLLFSTLATGISSVMML